MMDSSTGFSQESITNHLLLNFEQDELCQAQFLKDFDKDKDSRGLLTGSVAEQGLPGLLPPNPYQLDMDFMFDQFRRTLDICETDAVLRGVPDQPGFVTINVTDHILEHYFDCFGVTVEHEGQMYVSATKTRQKSAKFIESAWNVLSPAKDFRANAGQASVPSVFERISNDTSSGIDAEILEAGLLDPIKAFNLDWVPAIPCAGWPRIACEWLRRSRNWPPREQIKEIYKNGYHLVPKSSPNGNPDLEWRISFSRAEVKLAETRSNVQRRCFDILKTICKEYLSSVRILNSYHLKTIMMWACEKKPRELWKEEKLGACVVGLLDELLHCFVTKNLPHYFIASSNLLTHMSYDALVDASACVLHLRKNLFSVVNRQEPLMDNNPFHPTKPFTRNFTGAQNARLFSKMYQCIMEMAKQEKSDSEEEREEGKEERKANQRESNTHDRKDNPGSNPIPDGKSTAAFGDPKLSLGEQLGEFLRYMKGSMESSPTADGMSLEEVLEDKVLQTVPAAWQWADSFTKPDFAKTWQNLMIPSSSDIQEANRKYIMKGVSISDDDEEDDATPGESSGNQGKASSNKRLMKQLDIQVRSIMVELLPQTVENSEKICSEDLLQYLSDLTLALTEQTVGRTPEQLPALLQISFNKYTGKILGACEGELLMDIAEVLLCELYRDAMERRQGDESAESQKESPEKEGRIEQRKRGLEKGESSGKKSKLGNVSHGQIIPKGQDKQAQPEQESAHAVTSKAVLHQPHETDRMETSDYIEPDLD